METGVLKLKLLNVYGEFISEKVDITLRHQTLSHVILAKEVKTGSTISIKDLHRTPQGLYRIEIDPPSYLPVSQFVTIKPSGPTPLTITFPVDPKKVIELRACFRSRCIFWSIVNTKIIDRERENYST